MTPHGRVVIKINKKNHLKFIERVACQFISILLLKYINSFFIIRKHVPILIIKIETTRIISKFRV